VDEVRFDSKREAKRYVELRDQQRAGLISGLRLQVSFPIRVGGDLVCRYVADFVYVRDEKRIVEDVKGLKTPVYKLKKRLMQAVHKIEIQEV
jgi:hypothetical protein